MEFIMLMHSNTVMSVATHAWSPYLDNLRQRGIFDGGSSIGDGETIRRETDTGAPVSTISGYIRIQADDLDVARTIARSNPVYLAGGTIEIRELSKD